MWNRIKIRPLVGGNGIISVREERMIRGLSSERKNNRNIFFPFLGKSPSRIYVRKEKNLVSVNGILIEEVIISTLAERTETVFIPTGMVGKQETK